MEINSVVIYGKTNCPFCIDAVKLCENNEYNYNYILVGQMISKEELIEKIGHEVNTVPQIFVNGYYVGGFEEFYKLVTENKQLISFKTSFRKDLYEQAIDKDSFQNHSNHGACVQIAKALWDQGYIEKRVIDENEERITFDYRFEFKR